MQFPTQPAMLTAAWLTSVLRHAHARALSPTDDPRTNLVAGAEVTGQARIIKEVTAKEIRVTQVKVTPLAEAKGFYGQVMRLHLDYANPNLTTSVDVPLTLIAKFAAPNVEMRQRSRAAYEREVRFYQQLAPVTPLPVPRCYFADIDLASGHHLLLLQDLAPWQSGTRAAGCTPEQAGLAIQEIAKLHVTWWGSTGAAQLDWLADGDVEPDGALLRQQYEQWWPRFYAEAHAVLPPDIIEASRGLGEVRALLRRHIFGTAPRTLIHRDYHLENLFFGAGAGAGQGSRFDSGLAIVDWQFLSRGRGVWDVAYFLSENLLPDVRRAVEGELLATYHAALVAHGIRDYSFANCAHDYRLCLLLRHTALVSTIAAMPFSNEQRQLHIHVLLARNLAAIADHDAFGAR